ncbi:MAG: glycosyltransferase family 4 protein [Candidatus Omnitrophica bacterium]|nr:glycosyltransferase family 4 protein [Candidatus Omnitrophota bacterium]
MSKKKIGYIVSLFPCWSETFILNEIIELEKKGYVITIFSIRKDFEKYTQEKAKPYIARSRYLHEFKVILSFFRWLLTKPHIVIPLSLKIIKRSAAHSKTFIKNVWCIMAGCYFADMVIREKIEHLHAHFASYPTLVALVISKLTNIKYTFTCHAHDIFLDKILLDEKVKAAKAVVTISDYNKQYITKHCGHDVLKKIFVIHCGLDLREWNYHPPVIGLQHVIVCVGRLTEMKGFEYLIHACHKIKDKLDFKCHIVGDGHLRSRFEQLINGYGLQDKISLDGVLDSADVRELIVNATVFVVPSIWNDQDGQDGIPLVLMEALAIGTPSIASRISGIPELIIDGETGFLTEPGNTDQLAEKLNVLLNDGALQVRLAKAGRKKIEEEFNIEKNAELLAQLF